MKSNHASKQAANIAQAEMDVLTATSVDSRLYGCCCRFILGWKALCYGEQTYFQMQMTTFGLGARDGILLFSYVKKLVYTVQNAWIINYTVIKIE